MVSPFGEGVPGLFLDGDAGELFARALRDAGPARPSPRAGFLRKDGSVLAALVAFDDAHLLRVRNAEIAAALGVKSDLPVRDALRKMRRMGVVRVSGQGKARQIRINRVLAGQLLALVFPAHTVADRAPQPSAARE
jgi:hypothetical protein